MGLRLTVPPAVEPVSLDEVKSALPAIEHNADDAQLDRLIIAARQHVERVSWLQLVSATYALRLRSFPWWGGELVLDDCAGQILLPRPPLQSVTSIQYVDWNGQTQTLASTEYLVDVDAEPATIEPAYGKWWPTTRNVPGAVIVTYVAGYGDAPTDVPETYRDGIIKLVRHCYDGGMPFSSSSLPAILTAFIDADKFRDARIAEVL